MRLRALALTARQTKLDPYLDENLMLLHMPDFARCRHPQHAAVLSVLAKEQTIASNERLR